MILNQSDIVSVPQVTRLVFLDQNTGYKFYIKHVIRVLLDKHDKFVAIHARNVASDTWKM